LSKEFPSTKQGLGRFFSKTLSVLNREASQMLKAVSERNVCHRGCRGCAKQILTRSLKPHVAENSLRRIAKERFEVALQGPRRNTAHRS